MKGLYIYIYREKNVRPMHTHIYAISKTPVHICKYAYKCYYNIYSNMYVYNDIYYFALRH